jgi:hypothetical protein
VADEYATTQQVAQHLLEAGLIDSDEFETLLSDLAVRASRLIDAWFGKYDGYFKADAAASIRYYNGNDEVEIFPDHMAVAPTEVAVAEAGDLTNYTVWASTDYILYPLNAVADGQPFRSILIDRINGTKWKWYKFPQAVKITAQWGWHVEVHPVIEEACIVQVARWFKRGQQAFQDAGAVTDLTQLRYLKKIDPEVQLLLSKMPGGITI